MFSKIWKWLAVFFAGIIAGMVAAMKLVDPRTTITASNYIAEQTQTTKIGKVKNNGQGTQTVDQSPTQATEATKTLSRRELRKARRAARKAKREAELQAETEKEEAEQAKY